MKADLSHVIVMPGTHPDHLIPTTLVHHRDYPELWAEGGTAREAVAHLVRQFARAIDGASTLRGREPLHAALGEVRAFLQGLIGESAGCVPERHATRFETQGATRP